MDIDDVATPSASELPEGTFETGKHLHNRLKWVTEDRRDANKKKPTDPDYDPRTLYVPPEFLRNETPAMRQWWEFKSRNFDTLLFFKVRSQYTHHLIHRGLRWNAECGMISQCAWTHHGVSWSAVVRCRWASSTRSSITTPTSRSRSWT
jgi:hypothetical protein